MTLLPVSDALERLLRAFTPVCPETVPLRQAHGRIAAKDIKARLTQPPFDASAMDGYAVRHADLTGGPAILKLIGEAPAGSVFSGTIGPGEAVRIFTGGVMPKGADTVIIQENTEKPAEDMVRILESAPRGKNIRRAGGDFRNGDILVEKGTRLTSRHIGLLAAANVATLPVSRIPRVALLSTGDELVEVGGTVTAGQIVNSNAVMLSTLLEHQGAEVLELGIARDNESSLRIMAEQVRDVDLFVTIGGASVGDHDLVQKVLGTQGLEVDFWKIAMRPGKPLIFGHYRDIPMLGLPGNPASAYVCALVFLLPALHRLQGRRSSGAQKVMVSLSCALPANGPRQHYMRARIDSDAQGRLVADLAGAQDSGWLSPLARSNGLLIRPPQAPAAAQGALIPALMLPE